LTLVSCLALRCPEPPPQGEAARLPSAETKMAKYVLFVLSFLNQVTIAELDVEKKLIDRPAIRTKK
jgi:hypothetical protein